jgi:hypothetical protein
MRRDTKDHVAEPAVENDEGEADPIDLDRLAEEYSMTMTPAQLGVVIRTRTSSGSSPRHPKQPRIVGFVVSKRETIRIRGGVSRRRNA